MIHLLVYATFLENATEPKKRSLSCAF